jgi:hypothetical protein
MSLKPGLIRLLKISAFVLLLAPLTGAHAASDASDPFVHPPELERDVRFWIRVYTEVTTDGGLLHDDWNLGLVYEVLRFDPGSSPSQRERRVTEASCMPSVPTPRRLIIVMPSTASASNWGRRIAFTKG